MIVGMEMNGEEYGSMTFALLIAKRALHRGCLGLDKNLMCSVLRA